MTKSKKEIEKMLFALYTSDEVEASLVVDKDDRKNKYRFTNAEIGITDENGKQVVYKICDICGRGVQSNAGYRIEYEGGHGESGSGRCGLCRRCANRIIPLVQECFLGLWDKERELREKYREDAED